MPKYTVELDDGRKVSFEADAPMSRQQIEETAYEAVGHKPEPGLLDKAKGMAVGAYNAVTGADRQTPEMSSMGEMDLPPAPTFGGALKSTIGMAAASDDKQRQEIIAKNYPGATFRQDPKGNTIVNYQGKDTALNKPGLSQADLLPALTQGYAYLGGAVGGAKGLAPFVGRVLGAGTGAAATSAALDTTANLAGAKKDAIEIGKSAGFAGAFGSGAELLAPVAGKVYQVVRNYLKGAPVINAAGGLTDEAKAAMQSAGINPDDMTDEFMGMLRKYAEKVDDPAVAARAAQGQALPVPVQQTRGQLTMDPQAQRFEEGMRAGSYGDTAGQRMRGVAADQQTALRENLDVIQGGMSGGERQVVQTGQGGAMASNRLNQMRDAEKMGVDAAYENARAAGGALPADAVQEGAIRVRAVVNTNHNTQGLPRTNNLLDELDQIAIKGEPTARVRELYEWRQRATAAARNPTEEGVALRKAIDEFDVMMDEALSKDLLQGSDDAIAAWREAIGKNKQFAARFKGEDMVGKLTKKVYNTDSRELAVDASSAANYILGSAKMGPIARPNIVPDLRKLRTTLGADSPEWNAIREEAFMRFAGVADGASPGGVQQFSGVNFKTNWENAWKTNEAAMSQLFTQAERAQINQLADVAARVTSQTKYGSNPSGTSYAMMDLLKRVPLVGRAMARYGVEMQGMSGASQALKVPYKEIPAGYMGAVGATAGTRDY